MNFRLSPAEFAYIVEHSGASVLLVDPEIERASWPASTSKHRFLLGEEYESGLLRFDAEPRPWSEPDEDATATINYTSGTTARPKGVQMTHRNVWVNATTFGMHMQVSDRDVYLHTLPMFHCNGWGLPYTSAGLGVTQVPIRKIDGAEILRRVEQHGVTLMAGAPAVWNAVLDAAAGWDGPVPGRDQVRIVVAGAPPPSRTIARVEEELGWEFNQIYGLTETAPLLTINRPRAEYDDLQRRGPGQGALPGRACRRWAPGSRSARAARCWPRATPCWPATGRTRTPRPRRWTAAGSTPGTAARIDDGGYLTISDRKKDVIITGGENVSSIEVEDAVFSHPAVAEVAVIGVPDDKWGEMVTALVVARRGAVGDRGRAHRPHAGSGSPATRRPSGSSSARRSRAPPPARSRSSSSGRRSGRTRTARSTRQRRTQLH